MSRVEFFLGGAILAVLLVTMALAQTESATVAGRISDDTAAAVSGAEVQIVSVDRGTKRIARSNETGIYAFSGIQPGRYHMTVTKGGFRQVDLLGLVVNVQDRIDENFRLQVGSVSESVTVTGVTPIVNTQDATVSTVIDRNFAENLPMNGRSFQTLIQLTPGVVLTQSNGLDGGQFSVNGQRANSNYWTVDGVSANVGVSSNFIAGNGAGGALPGLTVQGGTNSLVSVDAMQEFRIQTSTYAPEFGRTPGGQISVVTRSGTDDLHGTAFDYFRNDLLDANDWFANRDGLAKPKERQNDFGGTISGPIRKDRTFFFFSFEGLRLRLPAVGQSTVPDSIARQNAVPALRPFLNAFPLPNGVDDASTGVAGFNASFSNSSNLNAYSLRIDHKLPANINLFARYDYAPSDLFQRGFFSSLNTVTPTRTTTQTATVGATWLIKPSIVNDLRVNYSKSVGNGSSFLDDFGGAVPLASSPFPSPFTSRDSEFGVIVFSLSGGLVLGDIQRNVQRQINIVDSISVQRGPHALKFGVDYRRLSPIFGSQAYAQFASFFDVPSFQSGNLFDASVQAGQAATFLLRNIGVFAQDTFRVADRLTFTYGLRWDVDCAPSTLSGPALSAVQGFNLIDPSRLALAPTGTPPFATRFGNLAPRIGAAYQVRQNPNWETVLRGGVGLFYDLATQELGNNIVSGNYPFGAGNTVFGGIFPLSSASAAPPPVSSSTLQSGVLHAFDPHLALPYTLQWTMALDMGMGKNQNLSASYVGATGRRLIGSALLVAPNPSFGFANLVTNSGTSDYNALQLQFQRRLSAGLQMLASYAWAHSIDTASAGSNAVLSNALVPGNANANRASSDFDIRNGVSVGMTYSPSVRTRNRTARVFLGGWSFQNVVQARTAPPITVFDGAILQLRGAFTYVRPDVVNGQPPYVFGSQCSIKFNANCPGGKGLNPAAFTPPPTDANGTPLRQGNLPRNALRGFGSAQWDFALHREFSLNDTVKLQFRAEMFNLANHPNFGPMVADISNTAQFGRSVQMLGQSLNASNLGGGGLSPLYQIGGPRSVQLALKLLF